MYISSNYVTAIRKNVFLALVGLCFFILFARLYYLQIFKGSRYKHIAEANRVRVVPIEAPRGIIYDRNGLTLLDNKLQYNVNVIPYELNHNAGADSQLAKLLNIDPEQINSRIKVNWQGPFIPTRVASDVDFFTITKIEEYRITLPGVTYSVQPVRYSPSGVRLSHTIGYVREVGKEDLATLQNLGYKKGDLIGWRGVERQYEKILKGERGYDYIQVDALGREVETSHSDQFIAPIPGNDLYLTIDRDLQLYLESLMANYKGAAVVLDANNGEIYAITSKPDFPPEILSGVITPETWKKLINDPDQPLYNRAIQGVYPAGSTFKLIAVLTALENNVIDDDWSVVCYGQYRLGRRIFKCWKEDGHGRVNLHEAIVHSCNVFFYNLIKRMDLNKWAATATLFKFGQPTGIDIPGENNGILPTPEFLDSKYGKDKWSEGIKLNLVIGQGDLLVTPIQMARFVAALGTRGKLVQPHVGLKYIERNSGREYYFSFKTDSINTISIQSWEYIEKAMFDVVERGTGRAAKVKDRFVGGKTGTAQNPHGEPHGWFIGYIKLPTTTFAIAVLIEHGRSGGGAPAQIAGKVFNYLNQRAASQLALK